MIKTKRNLWRLLGDEVVYREMCSQRKIFQKRRKQCNKKRRSTGVTRVREREINRALPSMNLNILLYYSIRLLHVDDTFCLQVD